MTLYTKIKKSLFLLTLIVSCYSCSNPTGLEIALNLSGDNRTELEKVLLHYQDDTLKLKAAVFLIENMPGHYSYQDTACINEYYNAIDSVALIYKGQKDEVKDSLYRQITEKYNRQLKYVEDLHCITAAFLIDNIDRSFEVWQNGEWATHIDFEDFCEYILPYKVCDAQILDNWREYFASYCNGTLATLQYCQLFKNAAYNACAAVNNALRDSVHPRLVNTNQVPVRRMRTLTKIPYGLCEDYTVLSLAVMRSKGIPTIIDYTPQWAFRDLGHNWCVLIETSGKKVVFEGIGTDPASPHREEHRMAKVFRKTYAINREIEAIFSVEKYLPTTFIRPFMKDVTTEYQATKDIEIPIAQKNDHKYAYLSIFDNANWLPIHWGKVAGKKIRFEKMGKRVVYLPVFYGIQGIEPFAEPLILTARGKIIELKADTLHKQQMILYRKYPPFQPIYDVGKRIVGGRIQVATDSLFRDSLTLHTISEYGILAREINLTHLKDSAQARYWRYYPPDGAHCNIAELFFYEKDSIQPTKGRILGSKGSFRTDGKHGKEAVFDRDALTFFDASAPNGCWVGMDFGRRVQIDRIIYLPRNDGNCIEIGDEYELFYWGNNRWQSLGKKIAGSVVLEYDNCPSNALFLLHNHTKGKEERIFTYENEEQIWW
ncbi:hypothetical protein EZS27_003670 [termite gut metagenome]|jgi:hypothetical protein|uniref:Peptide-N(4)-(N-acetyl-beta-glucosaminyl)asparagine amidase n=1 Tax=termite gut metagenome TaxID=433724 RepID=A0A5J4SUK1_9ZZZZ